MGSLLDHIQQTTQTLITNMKFLAAFLALIAASQAKIYNRCDLAYELIHSHGFAKGSISEWICLISHESGYNTAAKGGPNYDGSYDWGLFQINDYYWCKGSGDAAKYNDCNVNCSSLTNSNISDDCDCAKLIWNRHGFDAWYGWQKGCKGKDTSSYISGCKL